MFSRNVGFSCRRRRIFSLDLLFLFLSQDCGRSRLGGAVKLKNLKKSVSPAVGSTCCADRPLKSYVSDSEAQENTRRQGKSVCTAIRCSTSLHMTFIILSFLFHSLCCAFPLLALLSTYLCPLQRCSKDDQSPLRTEERKKRTKTRGKNVIRLGLFLHASRSLSLFYLLNVSAVLT